MTPLREKHRYSALFVDFENIYYYLKNNLPDRDDPTDTVVEMIRRFRDHLAREYGYQNIITMAFADFERVTENAQGPLYLAGVETRNVLSTDQKNAADMRLCIEVLETMYTRDEIEGFAFMAGDRDYIPVIQHLRKHARDVQIVAFQGNISGDLLNIVGNDQFIRAESLLPEELLVKLREGERQRREQKAAAAQSHAIMSTLVARKAPPQFSPARTIENGDQRLALGIMLKNFGDKSEVWVTPFLHKLREEMSQLAEYERKVLITDLAELGALRVEKRPGEPNPYSVILINWDHPDVRALNAIES